jgi:hypothetical protein
MRLPPSLLPALLLALAGCTATPACPPGPPRFCTRSLGTPDCWSNPEALSGNRTPIADTPALTAAQEADCARADRAQPPPPPEPSGS